jgi:hypothetical protein
MAIWYILWLFGILYGHLVYYMAIWYILWPFGIFYGHLVYSMAIWYILWPFGIFYGHLVYSMVIGLFYGHLVYFHVLVHCTKKNLATLVECFFSSDSDNLGTQFGGVSNRSSGRFQRSRSQRQSGRGNKTRTAARSPAEASRCTSYENPTDDGLRIFVITNICMYIYIYNICN